MYNYKPIIKYRLLNNINKGVIMECEFPSVNANKKEIKEIFESVKTIAV